MAVYGATAPLRTWDNMSAAKAGFKQRIVMGESESSIYDEAKRIGVNINVKSAFAVPRSGINPIGPNPNLDNPWSCCPPVFLHGMEAGTLMKVPDTTLQYIIQDASCSL
jgi:hypothetical protein